MAKASTRTTPSFICELALVVNPANEGVILARLEAARQMYNACLGQAMKRVNLIRQSKDFNRARPIAPSNPQRKVLFKRARERYDFSEYALHCFITYIRNSWIGNYIDANTAQKIASRAFNAAQKVLFGQAKKARFKGKNQFDSVEGKSNKLGIRWKGEAVEWSGLKLPALISRNDPVILHGLNSKVKYVRLVRRKINGYHRFYAQLVCQEKPFKLEKLSYKAFQKLFGKSVGKCAPGMFVSYLKSKAERAGGNVVEIPTYSTKLSQTCQCGRVKKKQLCQRVHKCVCGIQMQRDLYSAFLAKHIQPDTFVLQVSQLVSDWHSAELCLWAVWRTATECTKPTTGRILLSFFGRCPEVEWVATEVFKKTSNIQDVVGESREPGRGCSVKEPPG